MLNYFKIIIVLNTQMCYIWDSNTWKAYCELNFVVRLIIFGVDLRKLLPIPSLFNSAIVRCGKGGSHSIPGYFDETNKQKPKSSFSTEDLTTTQQSEELLLFCYPSPPRPLNWY